jgi:serine/threonine-protein kinase
MTDADLGGRILAGRYRLRRRIGEGGMGVVYEAENVLIGKRVAVKILSTALSASDEQIERFEQEARAAAALGHPNIIDVLDFGREGSDLTFFVMEMLDGRSLADALDEEGRLAVPRAIEIAGQTLDGLAAAHDAGIVHRDIKPENIFLCRRSSGAWKGRRARVPDVEQVKILDFGISIVNEAAKAGEPSTVPRRRRRKLTRPGTFMGTAWYASPEQARGRPDVGPAADVWAVGAVLYEMLSGEPPFDAPSDFAVLYKVLSERHRRLAELCPDLPRGLSERIDRALAKEPADRYPTAESFAEALVPFAGDASAEIRRASLDAGPEAPGRSPAPQPALAFEQTVVADRSVVERASRARPRPADAGDAGDAAPVAAGMVLRPEGAVFVPVDGGPRAERALRRAATTTGRALPPGTTRTTSGARPASSRSLRIGLAFLTAAAVISGAAAVIVVVAVRDRSVPAAPGAAALPPAAGADAAAAGPPDAVRPVAASEPSTEAVDPGAADVSPESPDAGVPDAGPDAADAAPDVDAGTDDAAGGPDRQPQDAPTRADDAVHRPSRPDAGDSTGAGRDARPDAGVSDAAVRPDAAPDAGARDAPVRPDAPVDGGGPEPPPSADASAALPGLPDGMMIREVRREIVW